jgi:pheromone receptor transcription factor
LDQEYSDDSDTKPTKRNGRRKIKIEYIEDKNRRHITFSKRKAGIMKKVKTKEIANISS